MAQIIAQAVDPTGLGASAGVTISFGNAVSNPQGDVRTAFLNLLETTFPAYGIAFGGVNDVSSGVSPYFYNSSPFGNCGQFNALGGAYLSYTYGYEYKLLYSDFGHVICAVRFEDEWKIVETFAAQADSRFMKPPVGPPDDNPFYTLAELRAALDDGDPTGIWPGANQNIRDYYGDSGHNISDQGVVIPVGDNPSDAGISYTAEQWNPAALTLAANETARFQVASYDHTTLYDLGQATPLVSQSYTQTQSPSADHVTVVRTEDGTSPAIEHIESGSPIAGVGLRPQPGFVFPPNTPFHIQSWYAAPVYPVAPTATIALPEFTRGTAQDEWLQYWNGVAPDGPDDLGKGTVIRGGSSASTELTWKGNYTNASFAVIWIPIVFRTDTPRLDGSAVATLSVGSQTFDVVATDSEFHYQEFFVLLPAGQPLALTLRVMAGVSLDIRALGTETNISDIISPTDTAMAVDVDLSGISYRSGLELVYAIEGQNPPLLANEAIDNDITPLRGRDPWPVNEAVVTRSQSAASPSIEHIETSFYITAIDFTAKQGVSLPGDYLDQVADAVKIWAAAPSWATALPGFTPRVDQPNWMSQWTLVTSPNATAATGHGLEISNPSGVHTYLTWAGNYTNNGSAPQFIWLPLVYRSDTPSPVGNVGTPVATLVVQTLVGVNTIVGNNLFNIYPADRELHYKDILVQVDPGQRLRVYLQVFPEQSIEILALGSSIDISGILSPDDPAYAVDVDFSGLPGVGLADYKSNIDLAYALMVNPYFTDATMMGTAGDDTLSSPAVGGATMIGGGGNDLFYVHNAADVVIKGANQGSATIDLQPGDYTAISNVYVLPDNVGSIVMSTTGIAVRGNQLGNTFFINDASDVVIENASGGIDRIVTTFNYTLGVNIENLLLRGNATIGVGNSDNNTITGNESTKNYVMNGREGNDRLEGNSGNDVLDGGPGADTLVGGDGRDSYLIDNVGDVIVEAMANGIDSVTAYVNYTLSANVENMQIVGPATTGVGSVDNNIIAGNALANTLNGMGGNDHLYGYDGNDAIYGGAGDDVMVGGKGNDTYIVDSIRDVVTEIAGEGIDGVYASITYTLPNNVENLLLSGAAAINGIGNAENNTIKGNAADNILNGMDGNDQLYGEDGLDVLDGHMGADRMNGGKGNDSYFVDNAGDVVTEVAGEGYDSIFAAINFTLPANVEAMLLIGNALTGVGNGDENILSGNALNNVLNGLGGNDHLYGYDGNDVLDGHVGFDKMYGGAGNDSYIVDNVGDVVTELAGEGKDSVSASINYTLTANVENLQLTGIAISATGNSEDNIIAGNGSNNVINGLGGNDYLYGHGGNDTLDGGAGRDVLFGGAGNDRFLFTAGFGRDTISDFVDGEDTIAFASSVFATFAAVQSASTQVGADVNITFDASNVVTVKNITLASLTSADFLFV